MKNFVLVDILETKTDLDKKFPYFLFLQRLFILHFQIHGQVSVVAILHYNIQSIILNKGLFILYNERMDKLTHDRGFIQSLNKEIYTLFLAFSLILFIRICFKTQSCLSVLLRTLKITP